MGPRALVWSPLGGYADAIVEKSCPNCGASVSQTAKVCGYCSTWLVTPGNADEEIEILREMQRLSQGLENAELVAFWQGAPLLTKPHAMLQDVLQSLARLKPGTEAWGLNSFDGELNNITKQRIKNLLLSLKMESTSHPEMAKKVAMLEKEFQAQGAKAGCFPAEARIWTPEGERPIASFAAGDPVLSFNPRTGVLRARAVTAKLRVGVGLLTELQLADGKKLQLTSSHTLLCERGWLMARKLKPGDKLVRVDRRGRQEKIAIADYRRLPRMAQLYTLHTSGEHSFIVEGTVAHNFSVLRRLRTHLHRVFIDPRREWSPVKVGSLPSP